MELILSNCQMIWLLSQETTPWNMHIQPSSLFNWFCTKLCFLTTAIEFLFTLHKFQDHCTLKPWGNQILFMNTSQISLNLTGNTHTHTGKNTAIYLFAAVQNSNELFDESSPASNPSFVVAMDHAQGIFTRRHHQGNQDFLKWGSGV